MPGGLPDRHAMLVVLSDDTCRLCLPLLGSSICDAAFAVLGNSTSAVEGVCYMLLPTLLEQWCVAFMSGRGLRLLIHDIKT